MSDSSHTGHRGVADFITEAAFTRPDHVMDSAWLEHGPFAFWLVETIRPRTIVELGAHRGYSFFVFCQAARRAGLPAACFAVDTWEGDEHAGWYGDEVFDEVDRIRRGSFPDSATLLRERFDQAVERFSDKTVDLLHIDGRHRYEDVLTDYETWLPKLADRGVVLFHDTNVRKDDFGVWRLWEELRERHPSFEFVHGNGLGVLRLDPGNDDAVDGLLSCDRRSDVVDAVRTSYARLGEAISGAWHLTTRCRELEDAWQDSARGRSDAEFSSERLAGALDVAVAEMVHAARVIRENTLDDEPGADEPSHDKPDTLICDVDAKDAGVDPVGRLLDRHVAALDLLRSSLDDAVRTANGVWVVRRELAIAREELVRQRLFTQAAIRRGEARARGHAGTRERALRRAKALRSKLK